MLLIGCYTPDRGAGAGVSLVRTEHGLPVAVAATAPAVSPSFVITHPTLPVLYAVAETAEGAVAAWTLDGDRPDRPHGHGDTGGADPCHLAVDATGRYLVTVNYTGGSVAVHRLGEDGRILDRTDLVHHEVHGGHPRQDGPHPHMVRADGAGLLVTDLGGDAIHHYRLDGDGHLVRDGMTATPPESGPRHLVRAGDRWYVAAELSAEVLVYDTGWRLLGRVPATRSTGECLVSELATDPTGRYLYVANRGPDTVAVFALDGELPAYREEVAVGRWPRHFAVDGPHLLVAAERADELVTLRIDPATGVPVPVGRLALGAPTCVLVR